MNKHYNIFLDDERFPHNVTWITLPLVEWSIVRNYDDFVSTIQSRGLPQIISFDHDLSFEHYPSNGNMIPQYHEYKERTGFDCANWLVHHCIEKNLPLPECYIHTQNPIGRENIKCILDNYDRFMRLLI